MAQNQGDNVQQKARAIATAFETGVETRDLKPAIDALQQAARGNPEEYKSILSTANQMLDNSSRNNVKKFFGNMDITGVDGNGLKLKRVDGSEYNLSQNGAATRLDTGAKMEAPTRDGYGNRTEKVVDKDGTVRERMVTADGRSSVEKYTDKQGNHWEVEKHMQEDGTLRPTKISLPDGSTLNYEWHRQMGDRGSLVPTRFTEKDRGGRVVRDYEMQVIDKQTGRRNPAHWERKAGNVPSSSDFYGTIMVDSHNKTNITFRDPYVTENINADGNWTKTGFRNRQKFDESGRRTK